MIIRVSGKSAIRTLGQIKDPQAVEPLIAVLKDADLDTRQMAIQALGQIKDPRVVAPLIAVLADNDAQTRNSAIQALGKIRELKAVDLIISALTDGRSQDTERHRPGIRADQSSTRGGTSRCRFEG